VDEQAAKNCYMIEERRALLESLGGLPETTVRNQEWLYMLEEDTRQSLAIEGHFATEEELEAVLGGRKTDLEILNYFRIAQTVYDQALQYYRDKTPPPLGLPVVRHVHSELFRGLTERRGEFRKEGIQVRGAKVPPPEYDVDIYLTAALTVTAEVLRTKPVLPALARAHALFESIHPFLDGNGRVGRVLLNYLAISKGYPPIVIKGEARADRERYYAALEAADKGFHKGFPDPTVQALRTRLEEGSFEPLSLLLCEGLLPRQDRLIALALEQQEPLVSLAELASQLGVKESALRLRAVRGRLIAVKRGRKLYSHARLALPEQRRGRAAASGSGEGGTNETKR
jgi:Fic family protein